MSLVWREQLMVGNNVIDSDHKHLIEIINQAEQSLRAKNHREFKSALDSLSGYSSEHFAREEKIANAIGYTQAHKLHLSHNALLSKLERASHELNEEWTPSAIEKFSALLRDWLINHVIQEDLLMKHILVKYPPQFDGNLSSQSTISEKAPVVDDPASIRSTLSAIGKVLIVDDSATMRSTLNAILVSANIEVVGQLPSGMKLLQTIAQSPPDIVCLDYNLPGINGLELLKSIVLEHPQVAVVMITGEQGQSFRSAAAEAGAAGFIQKPFSQAQIIKELENVLYTKRLIVQTNSHSAKNDTGILINKVSAKKTAIIADDSKTMRGLLSAILSNQDIDVLAEATNGFQTVDLVVQHRPDVVCLDIDMPGKNGLDVLAEIRQKVPSSKVFMITGITKREAVMAAVKHGVAGFITKPFSPEKVGEAITKALNV